MSLSLVGLRIRIGVVSGFIGCWFGCLASFIVESFFGRRIVLGIFVERGRFLEAFRSG